ncbi:hypothetical protein OIU78_021246 [Salix suchowensis]|nr:hypothetical protein OIU78_021246 [Salix suchowensis]
MVRRDILHPKGL